MSGDLAIAIDSTEARALTDRIKVGVEAVWELVKQAYEQRAWLALGYSSWDDYCTREFGTTRLRLPREERAEVVASLRESGLSIRAIASATGLNKETVNNVTRELSGIRTPEPDEDALAEELIVAEQQLPPLPENYMNTPGAPTESTPGQTDRVAEALDRARRSESKPTSVIGMDGKTYEPKLPQQKPSKPRRKSITDEATSIGLDLSRIHKRLTKLLDDDRFARHREEIGCQIQPEHCLDTLERLVRAINEDAGAAR
ncbi:hypothetical protein [Mycobacterium sp. Lab-001]|uniref:hypothetical protein n=1 Tax=Mycobacterium sp. Lab-001 TaxID=3410136 RepID=UPI003D16BD9F